MSPAIGLDPALLEVLACPAPDHGTLAVDGPAERPESLTCTVCGRRYPVRHETDPASGETVSIPALLLTASGVRSERNEPRSGRADGAARAR